MMRRITNQKAESRKYNIPTISFALKISEGCISGYFSNKNIPTKEGLTAQQIAGFLDYYQDHRRGQAIDFAAAKTLLTELEVLGWKDDGEESNGEN